MNTECDEDIAYILKYGKPKPYKRPECKYAPPEEWEIKQDEYYCWRGTRIPQWFE